MQVLQAWFQSVDRDRSGEISAPELAQLNFNNRLLGQEPARKLIAIFDKDRSGQINFTEYASLHQFLNTVLAQFQASERKSPGFMSVTDVPAALQAAGFTSGFNLSPSAANNVAKRFDSQKRGQLTWEDFLMLASHVALLRSVFEWSDTDRDGKITFDFESFAFATLYL
jgi:Ca2+-binding EF-hand superfamily protein